MSVSLSLLIELGLVLRPPRCWLNINLADYYEYMQHLISQFWLNGLVNFSLSHAALGEAGLPPELPRSPHTVLHHQNNNRLYPKPVTESTVSQAVLNAHVRYVCGEFSRATSPLACKIRGPFQPLLHSALTRPTQFGLVPHLPAIPAHTNDQEEAINQC